MISRTERRSAVCSGEQRKITWVSHFPFHLPCHGSHWAECGLFCLFVNELSSLHHCVLIFQLWVCGWSTCSILSVGWRNLEGCSACGRCSRQPSRPAGFTSPGVLPSGKPTESSRTPCWPDFRYGTWQLSTQEADKSSQSLQLSPGQDPCCHCGWQTLCQHNNLLLTDALLRQWTYHRFQPEPGAIATPEQQKQIDAQTKRVLSLFKRQLAIPLLGKTSRLYM